VREIEAALKELGATAANRIARSALNRSATPIVKRAKRACSGRHGRASQGDHQAAAAAASRVGSADDPDRDREAYKSAGVFSVDSFVFGNSAMADSKGEAAALGSNSHTETLALTTSNAVQGVGSASSSIAESVSAATQDGNNM
jgi:hypothetical protein